MNMQNQKCQVSITTSGAAEMMHGFLFIVGTILAIEVIEVARALSSKT